MGGHRRRISGQLNTVYCPLMAFHMGILSSGGRLGLRAAMPRRCLILKKDYPMAVYVVNAYDIQDFDMFKQYPPQVRPLLQKHGARVLAMETNPAALEGTPRTMNAIIEFPSEEAVHDFYNDPAYQAFIHLRHHSTANCTMIILKQFETTG
jgi:uncharacterized protein (DUF1330 family)